MYSKKKQKNKEKKLADAVRRHSLSADYFLYFATEKALNIFTDRDIIVDQSYYFVFILY